MRDAIDSSNLLLFICGMKVLAVFLAATRIPSIAPHKEALGDSLLNIITGSAKAVIAAGRRVKI